MTGRKRTPGPTVSEPSNPAPDAERALWPEKVRLLVENKRLRYQPSTPADIAAVWQKAVESARDALLPTISTDGALRAAYDAGHLAALALLASHNLRTGGGPGHHEMAFYGAAAFGDSALDDLVPDSMEIRGLRKGSMYDPVIAGPAERQMALEWVQRTLPAIRSVLVAARRELESGLQQFP